MPFETLRDKIKEKLQGLEEIQEVYDYPTEDFKGYPCVVVRAMSNESDYSSTSENERHYVFELYIMQESEHTDRRKARRIIEGVVDEVMDAFDQDQYLSGISLPSGKTMLGLVPALSSIEDTEKYVMATITLTAKIKVDIV